MSARAHAVEGVERLDNEDATTSDTETSSDDLDAIDRPAKKKRMVKPSTSAVLNGRLQPDHINNDTSPGTINRHSPDLNTTNRDSSRNGFGTRNRSPPPQPVSERLTWSEDEDSKSTERRNKPRKQPASALTTETTSRPKPASRKVKAITSEPAIVGRRAAPSKKEPRQKFRRRNYDSDSSADGDESTAVPKYLKTRKTVFNDTHKSLGEAGLRLPPSYDDVEFSDDERVDQLSERPVFADNIAPVAPYRDIELRYSAGIVPAPIAQRLREYQVLGAEFLHQLFVFQRGGILGDDMGLGKTIQVIAFLTAAFGKTGDERDAKRMRKIRRLGGGDERWYPKVLIVCPATLMENWKSELKRWGWWQVDMFHGSPAARGEVLSAARMGRLEIMITTYGTYRLQQDAVNLIEWDCVIADECHLLKEHRAETTKAMNKVNALCRIGLTGTAIQNKYDELWTILNWTNPGEFGPLRAWKDSISMPLKLGQAHDATVAELAKARRTADKLVKNLLPPYFKRRMKTLIADQLPKKSDRVVFCSLTEAQAEAYENLVDSDLIQYVRQSSEPCDCGSGSKRGWCCYSHIPGRDKWQVYVFPMLANLQKLSNHLCMLVPSGTDQREKQEKDLECLQIALPRLWKDLYRNRDNIMNFANQDFCGKWKVLKKLLSFWHSNNDKVLVFSYSVGLLKMLQILFKSTTAYNVSYLDGSMSLEDRSLAVDDFNTNPTQFVFLISIKAGGVGLNITSANKVVVFDPNWNPSYDLQAQDRAYRIGQTRDVEVFRLISAGTVEEIVYARQIYKQQQANIAYNASLERRYFSGVQDNKDKKGEIFGLQNLFAFQGDNVVLREIVNKTNIAESKAGVSVLDIDMDQAAQDSQDHAREQATSPGTTDKEDAAISQLAAMITGEDAARSTSAKRRKTQGGSEHTEHEPDDDDDNDEAVNAASSARNHRKPDAISAILAGAGVEYTHENSEVVGSSRVETRLSERAARGHLEASHMDQHVFGKSQSQAEQAADGRYVRSFDSEMDVDHEHADHNFGVKDNAGRQNGNVNGGATHGEDVHPPPGAKRKYRPPEHVRKRQFMSMAAHHASTRGRDRGTAGAAADASIAGATTAALNADQVTDFALEVETWTQGQRRDFLDEFYRVRRRGLVAA